MNTREIKFRAWDKEIKLMRYGVEWQWDWLSDENMLKEEDWVFKDEHILMQYTGLKDKNGKEIYEGDIVRSQVDRGDGFYKNIENLHEEVYFAGGAFYPVCDSEEGFYEIIGNIYENPELLE